MGVLVVLFVYWLVVVGECTYLGRYAVRFIYQRGAAIYDTVRQHVSASDETLLLPVLARALVGRLHHTTLDVATGTGRVPLLLASQAWFDGVAYGLDFSPAMLAEAQAKAANMRRTASIRLTHGEAGHLPWPDAHFDLVTCLESLEYFPRPRQALAEMARVLRPGGMLVVSKYPDNWARWLPGKAFSTRHMHDVLQQLSMRDIQIEPWQPGQYEFVIAFKS